MAGDEGRSTPPEPVAETVISVVVAGGPCPEGPVDGAPRPWPARRAVDRAAPDAAPVEIHGCPVPTAGEGCAPTAPGKGAGGGRGMRAGAAPEQRRRPPGPGRRSPLQHQGPAAEAAHRPRQARERGRRRSDEKEKCRGARRRSLCGRAGVAAWWLPGKQVVGPRRFHRVTWDQQPRPGVFTTHCTAVCLCDGNPERRRTQAPRLLTAAHAHSRQAGQPVRDE